MHAQLPPFLQEENAGCRELLGHGSDAEFGGGRVANTPFLIGEAVPLLKFDLPIDTYQHGSSKRVFSSFYSEVGIRSFKGMLCLIVLSMHAYGAEENGKEDKRVERRETNWQPGTHAIKILPWPEDRAGAADCNCSGQHLFLGSQHRNPATCS